MSADKRIAAAPVWKNGMAVDNFFNTYPATTARWQTVAEIEYRYPELQPAALH